MKVFDLAIVGGGPAGMAAAEVAAEANLSVVFIDEQHRFGGQVLRQPPANFRVPGWLPGRSYDRLKAQLVQAEALPISTRFGMSIHSAHRTADKRFELLLTGADGGHTVAARRLLVATGCYDMPVAFPGWTLPGVTSAGAVQAFIKAQQFLPGDRFVLAGTHPLQIILGDQIVQAGGTVAAILFAQPASRAMAIMRSPVTTLAHYSVIGAAAAAMARLMRAGVPIHFGRTVIAAEGRGVVEAALVAPIHKGVIGPETNSIACDRIATCFGFLPQSDLPRALGAKSEAIPGTGGWRVVHDAWMRASTDALWVAGEVTGVAGADVSLGEGRLAGISIARDAGAIGTEAAERLARPVRRQLASDRRFAEMLAIAADPAPFWHRLADAETILCRCEDVAQHTVAEAIGADPAAGAGALKRATRIGMGRCQGRGCEHALSMMLETTEFKEGFAARMPIRAVSIGAIASQDASA